MLIIYTDGSALNNGSKNAVGGFGVVVCEGDSSLPENTYQLIDCYSARSIGTTNNRMEMKAIIYALKNYGAKPFDFFIPIVYSDSSYCVNTFNDWMWKWKRNGWTRPGNKPVENLDLVQEYDKLKTSGLDINLKKIRGHAGNIWNELADKLATGKITKEEAVKIYKEKNITQGQDRTSHL